MAAKYTALQVITPHRFGGAERIVANLSSALAERGHRIVVTAPERVPSFLEYLSQLGVEYEPLALGGKLNPFAAGRIAALARRIGADLLHTHLSSASLHGTRAARQLGLPAIAHVHAMSGPRWYRQAEVVVCCSRGVAEHLEREGLRGPELRVVHNGVRMEEFEGLRSAGEVRAELGLPEGARVIGCVAGLQKRKGVGHLVDAVGLLRESWPDLHLLVVGAGELRAELEEQARRLDIARLVHFLGFRTDRLDLMRAMEVHVLPAVGIEGFGLVIVEAAMLGVPSVASDLPGIDEVIADGRTGLLVPPSDSDALAKALGRLLGDEDLRRKLGDAGQARAREEFDIRTMAAGVEKLYGELVGR